MRICVWALPASAILTIKTVKLPGRHFIFGRMRLLNRPEAVLMLSLGLHPKSITTTRFDDTEKTLLLELLPSARERERVIAKLIGAGASPSAKDNDDKGLIDYVVARGDDPAFILISATARPRFDVNSRTQKGKLYLDELLDAQKYTSARVLVSAGAGSDRPWTDIICELIENDSGERVDLDSISSSPIYVKN